MCEAVLNIVLTAVRKMKRGRLRGFECEFLLGSREPGKREVVERQRLIKGRDKQTLLCEDQNRSVDPKEYTHWLDVKDAKASLPSQGGSDNTSQKILTVVQSPAKS